MVPEKNIVTYLINGLSPKFDFMTIVMRHKTLLPTFLDSRSIILLEEQQMEHQNRRSGQVVHIDHASSPIVLNVNQSNQGSNN